MKLLMVFLAAFSLHVYSNGFSQTKISVNVKHKDLKEVLSMVQQKSYYKILYNDNSIPDGLLVSVSMNDATIPEVLSAALAKTSLTYSLLDNYLVVINNAEKESPKEVITGRIVDDQNAPLVGASVQSKLETVTTDKNGSFRINADKGDTLIISYVGYETQRVAVGDQSIINISMKPASGSLNNVVVIGYGTQKKRDLTGAVSSIKGDDVKSVTVADASGLLQGKAAGVVVQNSGGAPGQAPAIVIRGSGTFGNDQPLYVIDGMIASSMAFVNPNDIASIEVLKDASAAAIYGSRAANGVVLVTTKAGTSGEVRINFNAKYGIQSPTNLLDFVNARQYADWNNMAHDNDGTPRGPLNDTEFNPNIDTDWQSVALGSAPISDFNLSISGGGQYTKFFISGQLFDQQGIVADSRFQRYAVRANSSFTKKKLKISQALSISRSLNNPNTYFGRERGELPTMPVYDPNKLGGFAGLEPADAGVPRVINWYGRGILNDNLFTTDQLLGNVTFEYEIIDGLKYKLNLGADYAVYHAYDYTPAFFMSTSQEAFQDQAVLNEGYTRALTTLVENTLNYSKAWGNHRFEFLAGYTAQKNNARSVGAIADTYASDLRVVDAAANRLASGQLQESALQSVFGRISYNYKSKYLLTATLRRDGSSKFRYPENTYGNFPSFSAGWRISEENFFPKTSFISDLKIRGSYGTLGSQNIPNYITQSTLNINTGYFFAGGVQNGVGLTNFANPDIRWESSTTTDIGLDLSMFGNQVVVTADYFDRRSYDILANIPIPIYGGAGGTLTRNAASVGNKGFELSVTYNNRPASKGAFKYSITGNFTTIRNSVLELGEGVNPIIGGTFTQESLTATRTDVGQPIGSFWGYRVLGIYQTQEEIDKDGRTDARPGDFRFSSEPTWLGSPFPDFDYGVTFNASYKNFDFSIFFQGVHGNQIWNAKRAWQYTFDYGSGKVTDVLRAWTPQNTNTDIPRATMIDPANNKRSSSFYVEDGSYLRLRNLVIGYNVPTTMLNKLKLTNARFYLSGQNLLTFTKYRGYDPEVGRTDLTGLFNVGVDVAAYPQARMVNIGIDLTF